MENVCAGAHQIKKRQKSTTPASETNFAFYVPQCEVECMWKGFGMIPREAPSREVYKPGRSTKKKSRKGKLNEKILARQLTPQNIHAMA